MKKIIIYLLVAAFARGAYVVSRVGHPKWGNPIITRERGILQTPTIPHFPGKQVPV